eukprot:2387859-Pleurochrysis_carterae.AAC.2
MPASNACNAQSTAGGQGLLAGHPISSKEHVQFSSAYLSSRHGSASSTVAAPSTAPRSTTSMEKKCNSFAMINAPALCCDARMARLRLS